MQNNESALNRREFLTRSLTGVASAGLLTLPGGLMAKEGSKSPEAVTDPIIRRKLGNTGIVLPVVSMGVMNTGNAGLVKAALEANIVHLDTAHGYSKGNSEVMLSGVLKDRSRDSFILSTKVEPEWDMSGGWNERKVSVRSAKEAFLKKLDLSLKRLQLDHVDILYLHAVNSREVALTESLLDALTTAKKEGKTRFIGVSFHENFLDLIQAAIDSKVYEVILTVYNIKMAGWKEMDLALEKAAQAGLGIIAMKTQAGVYWDEERKHPINMKAALKWALQNPNICTAIPGMTTFDQLSLDVSVMSDLKLTTEELQDLEKGKELGMSGLYCPDCGKCLGQCPKGLDIPTLMRSYMYAQGYQNFALAKSTLRKVFISGSPCRDCRSCSVQCSLGFPVRNRITHVARMNRISGDFLV